MKQKVEQKQAIRRKKVTITFDELMMDGNVVAFTDMDNVSLFNYEMAKRRDIPAIIIDCQHLKQRKAENIINHPIFRQLIVENIDKCEKAGFCIGLRMMPQSEKISKNGNK